MAEAFPLNWPDGWPRTPSFKRENSKFGKLTGSRVIGQLLDELRRLGARHVVISTNVPLRQDGLPYADKVDRKLLRRTGATLRSIASQFDVDQSLISQICSRKIWTHI